MELTISAERTRDAIQWLTAYQPLERLGTVREMQ